MAQADRKLANNATFIDFQTEPSKYRHWKLDVAGDVATLTMDVDENGGLFEGYQLKLNSYDLGVDIELADALARLRFEHPNVKVVLLRSAKDRVFCAGANIRMLAGSEHPHKVNFCKFTNETRNGLEDSSRHSGLKFIAAVNGACAGGGYELQSGESGLRKRLFRILDTQPGQHPADPTFGCALQIKELLRDPAGQRAVIEAQVLRDPEVAGASVSLELLDEGIAYVTIKARMTTGAEADERLVSRVKRAVPSHPVWLGSGVRVTKRAVLGRHLHRLLARGAGHLSSRRERDVAAAVAALQRAQAGHRRTLFAHSGA